MFHVPAHKNISNPPAQFVLGSPREPHPSRGDEEDGRPYPTSPREPRPTSCVRSMTLRLALSIAECKEAARCTDEFREAWQYLVDTGAVRLSPELGAFADDLIAEGIIMPQLVA